MRTKSGNGHKVDLEQLVEDLKVVVHDGEQLLKAGVSTVKERALTGARTTDRAVREHPYETLAIVFGFGILVGLLTVGMISRDPGSEEEETPEPRT